MPVEMKQAAGCTYALGAKGSAEDLCIYYLGLPQVLDDSVRLMADVGCTVVYVVIDEWDDQLTPWPAKGLYRGDADFKGEAPQFLKRLTQEVIPAIEAAEGLAPGHRGIAGYSLAGLFSVYAFANSELFESVASMSGSFWYEGWVEYLQGLRRRKPGCFAYLSLGDREHKAKEKILHGVQDATDATADILRSWGVDVESRLVPGGHFDSMTERVCDGLVALASHIPG